MAMIYTKVEKLSFIESANIEQFHADVAGPVASSFRVEGAIVYHQSNAVLYRFNEIVFLF